MSKRNTVTIDLGYSMTVRLRDNGEIFKNDERLIDCLDTIDFDALNEILNEPTVLSV